MKAKKAKARAAQGLGSAAEARPAKCSAARVAQSWSGGARINYLHLTNERS